ncbi:TonB-dependent receptor [Brumimicrobium mesophilum]|uniref:TonB-dependent receptor n=1 Tax=Brumimicrobium mesophilum TaxID=392717 RepID=UPI000D1430A3|nr:TonB-dependent receptor plug domain-containing protein [Brumimicrobium mesophilum]
MNKWLFLIFLSFSGISSTQECYFSGYIMDFSSNEPIADVIILEEGTSNYQFTNPQGYFSFPILDNRENVKLKITSFAYVPLVFEVNCIAKDTVLFLRRDDVQKFEEVTVTARKQIEIGVISLPIERLKQIPMLGGEPDIIKALQLQPGIQGGKEGTSGLIVRGGTPDQNLFLLDNVPVYNINHIGGFLSTIDANAIRSVKVYKGNFPAQYSGRLSSVLDIRMKNGNQKKKSREVQIGLLSTKLQFEGPVGKDSTWTYLASVRRFNLDIFTSLYFLWTEKNENFGYTFFDSNFKLVKRFKDNSTLSFGYYGGRDKIFANAGESLFDSPSRFTSKIKWGNFLGYAQYNKAINKKLFYDANLASTYFFFSNKTNLKETLPDGSEKNTGINFKSNITDLMLKQSLTFKLHPKWTIKGGWNTIAHSYLPGRIESLGNGKDTIIGNEKIRAWENNLYIENQLKLAEKLKANLGFNLSTFTSQGRTFVSPEPRALLQYFPNETFSIQAGYARMQQFMHLLSNNGGGIPNDIWIPATSEMLPEESDQFSAGIVFPNLFKQFPLDVTIEGYYKTLNNLIDYKEGSTLISPESLSSKVETNGEGKVFGFEFLIQRNIGKVNGWASYTYSNNQRKYDQVNDGNWYPFRFDRKHEISLVLNYEINERIDVSATWIYMSGEAFTLAQGKYEYQTPSIQDYYIGYDPLGNLAHIYDGKNSVRLPAYHRLDIGVNLKKQKEKGMRIWSFSLYNAYNQKNAFFYFYKKNEAGINTLHQVTVFPIIPNFSYRFIF